MATTRWRPRWAAFLISTSSLLAPARLKLCGRCWPKPRTSNSRIISTDGRHGWRHARPAALTCWRSSIVAVGLRAGFGRAGHTRPRVKYGYGPHLSQEDAKEKAPKSERLRTLLPDIWRLVKPRRWLLAGGFVLMVINRASGLVLPYSSKYLIDDVLGKQHIKLLGQLVLIVLSATVVQAVTSFALTQLLSKAAQRLIAEMRRNVQEHIGRLPLPYYDANKTGTLVSRIMSDVEGVRNLIGTGLVEFAGGVLTAFIVLGILLHISALLTGMALSFLLLFGFALKKAFGTIRPIFRQRAKINAEVTGRLTESLGGVRVVKGYHAEEREAAIFSGGVQRLLENVMKTLTATSVMSLSATLLMGVVGVVVMYVGARQIFAHTMTLGSFITFTALLVFMVAPVFQVVGIGTQISEAVAGLERTREVLHERPEDKDPRRTVTLGEIRGEVVFENVNFSYEPDKSVLTDISFDGRPGTVTALIGPSGAGKSTITGLIAAFYVPTEGIIRVDGVD